MRPLDPRLLRHARAARGYLALTTVLGVLAGVLVVAQAVLIGETLGRAVHDGARLGDLAPRLAWLVAVVAGRAAVSWCQERYAVRAAASTVAELREALVVHATALGPRWRGSARGTRLTTLATTGLDALEPYFVRYVPQLLLTAVVTPLLVVVVLGLDWVSGVVVIVTLPLVPLFMVLVGRLTQGVADRRLASLQRLGAQLLDLVAGLPTLRAFGRAEGPRERVRALGDANRRATMGTLRIAFLSGMVLELLTTLSVAIVAVGIGLRLVNGHLDLATGLTVLVLAPEVYLPLRQVGAQFHASTDGIAAAGAAFEVLEEPRPAHGTATVDLTGARLVLDDVAAEAPGRGVLAPAGLSLAVGPGEAVALVGANGAGKSTAVQVLLGLVVPTVGSAWVVDARGDRAAVADLRPEAFWAQVAWVPQRPQLAVGTLREAVLGAARGPADDDRLARAARLAALDDVLAGLPDGWDTAVGRGGLGLSVGQRQRVALAAALASSRPVVVLDEPTAHLDDASEDAVVRTVRALRDEGRAVLVVAHRPALVEACDRTVQVRSAPVPRTAQTGAEVPA